MTEPRGYGLYIKRINDCLDAEANRSLQSRDLTRTQAHFLMELRRRIDKTAALKELENRFGAAQSTVAGVAVRLEKKGLIVSFPSPEDKRVKLVRLTPAGEAICEASLQEITASEAHMLSSLTDCEQILLLNLLSRVYETMKKDSPHTSVSHE